MRDDEPTEKELQEAQALARALEGEGDPKRPHDAVEAAGLLRYSAKPELERTRKREILEKLLPRVPRDRRRRFVWVWPLVAAAAGVVLVLGSVTMRQASAPVVVGESPAAGESPAVHKSNLPLPRPTVALLRAQM